MTARLLLVLALAGCGNAPTTPEATPTPAPVATLPAAQAPSSTPLEPMGIGTPATAEEIAAWDIDVDPSGRGLPAGSGTVARGAELYAMKCLACHGPQGEGGLGPKLIAAELKTGFADDPKLPKTMGNWWPYATTAYDYIHRAMPQNEPGSLPPDDVYALAAFLLARNGAVGDDFVADAQSLPKVVMPTKIEFVADDRLGSADFR